MGLWIMSEPFTSYGPFVLRIIFHGCLLGLYPLILVYLVIGAIYVFSWTIGGTIIAGFVATILIFSLLLLDYMTLKRRPPPTLATIADFLLTGTLVPTMWIFPSIPVVDFDGYWVGSAIASNGWDPFFQTIRFGIPAFCFLYMLFLAIIPLVRTGAINSFFAMSSIPSHPSLYDDAPIYKRMYGPLRDGTEREELEQRCSSVIFRHTVVRKHPFEPPALGVIRGLFAVYALIGLITYGMSIVAEAVMTVDAQVRGQSVQRSLIPVWGEGSESLRVIAAKSVAYGADPSYEAVNISVTVDNNGNNLVNSSHGWTLDSSNKTRADVIYTFDSSTPNVDAYDSLMASVSCINVTLLPARGSNTLSGVDCNVYFALSSIINAQLSFPSAVRRSIWVFDDRSRSVGSERDPPPTNYSAPYIVPAGSSLDVYMSPEQKKLGSDEWLEYRFDTVVPSASTDNTSTVTLNPSYPDWITTDVMTPSGPPSRGATLLGVFGKLGGVFVTINGIFVVVFGRTVWAVVAGGRPITPFGIFSNFAWFRASIHKHYPRLQSDCETDGMAGFLEEVAMDVGIVQRKDRYGTTPTSGVGGHRPRSWSGEGWHEQESFIDLHAHDTNVVDRRTFSSIDK